MRLEFCGGNGERERERNKQTNKRRRKNQRKVLFFIVDGDDVIIQEESQIKGSIVTELSTNFSFLSFCS